MSKLEWDKSGEREYQSGVSNGVLFVQNPDGTYKPGVAWNGLTSASDNSEGGEPNAFWADNMKYAALYSPEDPKGKVKCYMYPDEFEECLGHATPAPGAIVHGQKHTPFGFCYRTEIGSDTTPEKGYILHFIYGCVAQVGDVEYNTQDDNPELLEFEFDFDCTPVVVSGLTKPTAHFEVNSINAGSAKMTTIENKVYGSDNSNSAMPDPDWLITTLNAQ